MRHLLMLLVLLLAAPPAHASFYDLLNAARANDLAAARAELASGTDPNGHADSYSPLQWAAQHGNTELLRLLLAAGADTERRDFNGDRALLWAARAGQGASIAVLLAAGSPANSAEDPYGLSPLHLAARSGYPEAVAILIHAGADVDAVDQSNTTALAEAVITQDVRMVYALLNAGADPDIANDILRTTPLQLAAERQDASIVRLLLGAGAAPVGWNSDGSEPLHLAAFRGLPDNVAALLEGGADPLALDDHGLTPLRSAIDGKRQEVWDNDRAALLLVPTATDITGAFLASAEAAMPLTTRALLDRGADPNARDVSGTPVLAYVALMESTLAVPLLYAMLHAGADLTQSGDAALLAAAESNRLATIERLLDLGVAIDGAPEKPPLLAAAQNGAVEAVEALLARGATPVAPERVALAELNALELLMIEQGEQSAAYDTYGEAIRQRVADLRRRQLAAMDLLTAAMAAR